MFDWQIKPLSKKSAISGRDIAPGDSVVCAMFVDALGNLDRLDCHADEFDPSKINGKIIGRWERTVSANPEEDEKAARRMALSSSEDFFVSLFDDSGVRADESDAIKQMLALLLERKRILRPVGRPAGGIQKYVQMSTKREFDVPQRNLDAELIAKIQTQLGNIII